MKKLAFILSAFTVFTAFTAVHSWQNDDAHSQLAFTVTHLGISDVSGTFNDFDVKVTTSKPDFSDAQFELTAKIASIDTRVDQRDNHLKSPDFFDAEKYPALTFKSTGLKPAGKNQYKLTGNLTLHGVTKPVTMDLFYKGTIEHPMNKKATAGFQVSGTIKRSDFGVGDKFPAPMVSDEVRIKADGEFVQP
ncbi:MAG TPA: YceI family protein [Chitinophagaceae bacterium]|jgi:polyisoprenoid-binding protein YceI|nr:YceI family protein [Chitinophagaceae bacterium]